MKMNKELLGDLYYTHYLKKKKPLLERILIKLGFKKEEKPKKICVIKEMHNIIDLDK